MPNRDNFNEISLKLASINPETRRIGFAELKTTINKITLENLTKISAALFYFYWYSESSLEQQTNRWEILCLMDEIPKELKAAMQSTFLESLVKLWESVDNEKVEKFLHLLKEFYFKVYRELDHDLNYKRRMVAWNDFLSTCIIFNPKCYLNSNWSRFGVVIRFAKNQRRVQDLLCSKVVFVVQAFV